jgi:hypothetical protein
VATQITTTHTTPPHTTHHSRAGADLYQKASLKGEELRGGYNTARWLVRQLERPAGSEKISLLDIGALSENYHKERSWVDVTAIDLNAQDPFVRQIVRRLYPINETCMPHSGSIARGRGWQAVVCG